MVFGMTPGAAKAAEDLQAPRALGFADLGEYPPGVKVLVPDDIRNRGDLRTLNTWSANGRIQLALLSPRVLEADPTPETT